MIISNRSVLFGCATLLVVTTNGCATQQKKIEQFLRSPKRINWRSADLDPGVLQSEMTDDRIATIRRTCGT